jgi:hypothetical protein
MSRRAKKLTESIGNAFLPEIDNFQNQHQALATMTPH